uniref:PDZ domain-containing protein n=1 Tax=Arundo donax TaxID=35708 RepID=A0A0A9B0D2_ARUDO
MTYMSDGDSSLSDPCSEDKSIASTQKGELVEGEISSTAELSAQVEQSAYNLRPRKGDSVKMQRRSEFARLREQQNQRRKRRKEAESEDVEFMECTFHSIKKFMDQLPKPRDVDFENRTEIINVDTNEAMDMGEWRPYFSSPDIGLFKTTLKGVSWEVEKSALQFAPFVVGLQSKVGDTEHFSCSGTVVEFSEDIHVIVTVANLVKKCPDTDELADGHKIYVYLHNHETCEGHLLYHDFYYNICLIRIESPVNLPVKGISANIEINFGKSCSRDVVTLGRDKETGILLVSTGMIIPKRSKFDCEELLVSTCRISKAEVGGPLMNFDGEFIGMNYYHTEETPFIQSSIVLKCLQQFTLFRKVVRPWHGLRVRTLYAEECDAFEKMQTNFCGATGVIIEKIEEQSSAKASGLNEGDIIDQVNGVYFSNAAELGGILLDIGTKYLSDCQQFHKPDDTNKISLFIKFRVRGCEPERTIVVDKFTSGGNRWPFPKPIIVRKYRDGNKVSEEWYAMECWVPASTRCGTQ